jgi:hypothetical protein
MRSAIKRSRNGVSLGDSLEDPGEDITDILRCIRQIKGELGIRPTTAAYHTVHGGLANSHNKWAQVGIDLVGLPKQSDYDSLVSRTTIAESQSNAAIRELNELRLRGNSPGEVAGLKTQLLDAQEEMKEMAGQMDMLVKIVQGMADAQALQGRVAPPPSGTFVTQAEFSRQVASVNLTLGGFRQELKGGALEFGGFKFESQDACRAWCLTHMPVNAYQCFSSMFYFLCLIQQDGGVVHGEDMRSEELHASRTQRSPMQSTHIQSCKTAVPAIFDGTKGGTRVPGCEFNGVKTFVEWKPPDGREGLGRILKEGLDRSFNAVKDAIKMTLAFHPVARLVLRELLAANKIVIMALFATEIPAYYDELLSKTGGETPSLQSKAACWALVTKLLRTIFKEVHEVRRFASEAVSLGADSLQANGMFLYAAVEEL